MNTSKPSIVFCHGIWADGSSLSKVIPPLQAEGCEVMAAYYGLDTREGDVATVKRTLGRVSSPVILVGHWDPTVTNRLAKDHEVILFDNAGVEASGGETPYTVVEMTQLCVAFCRALGFNAIHIVGFSLGGMIAQQLALDHPRLVQRLILLGTGRRRGEGSNES